MDKVMVGSNMMEEVDCGNFFDHIDDLLEFPTDDILDCDFPAGGNSSSFNSIMSNCSTGGNLLGSDSVFPGNDTSDFSAELSVPYEDIAQLEWLSTFVEDSFSGGGMTMEKLQDSSFPSLDKGPSDNTNNLQQFQTSSPISVLESSSSCSNNNNNNGGIPISHEKRARSKRPRPATFSPRPAIHHLIPTPSLSSSSSVTVGELAHGALVPCSSSESGTGTDTETATPTTAIESRPPPLSKKGKKKLGNDQEESKKKKKTKIVPPSSTKLADHDDEYSCWNNNQDPNPAAGPVAVRKCMHCEITKTPQWRAGPMGPKTLCNACGVRYKSGRLYPEYRPAASPTFIPALHSNSHKKVIEMRTKSMSMAPVTDNIKATSTGSIVISNAGELEATSSTTDHHHQVELISRADLTVTAISF